MTKLGWLGPVTVPLVCAPMLKVSGVRLAEAAMRAGIPVGLPVANARSVDEFDGWLAHLTRVQREIEADGDVPGRLCVNVTSLGDAAQTRRVVHLSIVRGIDAFIHSGGDPRAMTEIVHRVGGRIIHDVVTVRHAQKAIDAGVDGIVCIGAGGGGHAGVVSPLVLVSKIRETFDGLLLLGGAISNGAAVLAAQALGADGAYLGTRFIATQESEADSEYRRLIVESGIDDLVYTDRIAGVAASWLVPSIVAAGLDSRSLPVPTGAGYAHLPASARPWRTIRSAGQGIELIDDIPRVGEVVQRIIREYQLARQQLESRSPALRFA
jgi:nitronate monooxygenase